MGSNNRISNLYNDSTDQGEIPMGGKMVGGPEAALSLEDRPLLALVARFLGSLAGQHRVFLHPFTFHLSP